MPSKPLRADDLLVEVRDRNLVRRGAIPAQDLSLKIQPVFNGIGSWSISLPAEHRMTSRLRAPGSGIIITDHETGEIVMSGSTSKPSKRSTASDPDGMVSLAGLSDDRLLWDARAYPDPANANSATQAFAYDTRTGNAETLLREYAAYNVSSGDAPAGRVAGLRDFLRLEATNKNLGSTLTKRVRFDNLGELMSEIAIEGGGLGFRVVQVGEELEIQIYEPTDRTAFIRLDVKNGTLDEESVEFAPPEVTRMIVAGQGEGVDRQFVDVTTAEATAAEDDWGLVIEEFKDQRQTDILDELESAGLGELLERGYTKVAVKAVPSNDQSMVFLRDFKLGDKITIVVDGQETKTNITEAAIIVDSSGLRSGVAIGDIADFNRESALRQTVEDTTRRVEKLETNIGTPKEDDPADKTPPGAIMEFAGIVEPVGWMFNDGRSLLRSEYPGLYAALGTTYGADDIDHFNIPDMRGRTVVGLDVSQTEFDTLGKTGGEKAHTLTDAEVPNTQVKTNNQTPDLNWRSTSGLYEFSGDPDYHNLFPNSTGNPDGLRVDGGGQAHNNLQPYITLNSIIKI